MEHKLRKKYNFYVTVTLQLLKLSFLLSSRRQSFQTLGTQIQMLITNEDLQGFKDIKQLNTIIAKQFLP